MKEAIAAAVLVAIVAYFWLKPSTELPPEPRESLRPAPARAATIANNSTGSAGGIVVAPSADGSIVARWKTGSNAQTNLTATVPDHLKTGPK
jgi:hypothetical protein